MPYPCGMSQTHSTNGNGNGSQLAVVTESKQEASSLAAGGRENSVRFKTADGIQRHGQIIRVLPEAAFFEVYDPTLVLRLSEVLQDFQIVFHGRMTCNSRAVVRGTVVSGFKTTCEVSLKNSSWSGLNLFPLMPEKMDMEGRFREFMENWQQQYKISPAFKNAAVEMLSFFNDAHIWLNQLEMEIRQLPVHHQEAAEKKALQQLLPHFIRSTASINEKFEHELNKVERDLWPLHQEFVRKFLHSATQCSPFMHRAFEKPLGYAGDYEMVDMMFRDPFQGDSYFAKLLNAYALQLPPVTGHRNRILYLEKKLADESLRAAAQGREMKVFNLGCGPAREVQRFMAENALSSRASFTLADFEQETLAHTNRVLHDLKARHQRHTKIKTVKIAVTQLIKEHERHGRVAGGEKFDFVYCAGLFDYLSDAVCELLMNAFYSMLAPDGLLVATNVDEHGALHQMQCFLDWHLIYRDTKRMRQLTPAQASPEEAVIKRDPSGSNVFIEVRKPAGSDRA
jgi:extracellular factor (EF) 3-hydroxypalmitic acid methyl ester biosynthesis protein